MFPLPPTVRVLECALTPYAAFAEALKVCINVLPCFSSCKSRIVIHSWCQWTMLQATLSHSLYHPNTLNSITSSTGKSRITTISLSTCWRTCFSGFQSEIVIFFQYDLWVMERMDVFRKFHLYEKCVEEYVHQMGMDVSIKPKVINSCE